MPRVPKILSKVTPRTGKGSGAPRHTQDTEGNRLRSRTNGADKAPIGLYQWINPFPWMSKPEALVYLELQHLNVPFSWRFFDGDSPTLKLLIPDFAPEFTLREYRLAILLQGTFFGTVPGAIDRVALATVALQQDGWTVVTLFQADVENDLLGAFAKYLPQLLNPAITGQERPNPFGHPDNTHGLAARIRELDFARTKKRIKRETTRDVTNRRRSFRVVHHRSDDIPGPSPRGRFSRRSTSD